MGFCNPFKKTLSDEERIRVQENWVDLERQIMEKSEVGALMREYLGLYDQNAEGQPQDMQSNLYDWVLDSVGIDLRAPADTSVPMTMNDIAYLRAQVRAGAKAIADIKKFGASGKIAKARSIWRRITMMPKQHWNKIVGGKDVFLEVSIHEQNRNVDMERLSEAVRRVDSAIRFVSDDADSHLERERNSLKAKISSTKAALDHARMSAERGVDGAASDVENLSRKMLGLQNELQSMGDGEKSVYTMMQEDIADILTGKIGGKNDVRSYLSKRWGKYGGAETIKKAVESVDKILAESGRMLATASEAGRQVMTRELIRLGYSREDAEAEAGKIFDLQMQENYLPRMSIMGVHSPNLLRMHLKQIEDGDKASAMSAIKAHVAKRRTMEEEADYLLRKDVTGGKGVLNDYIAQVVEMEFANNVALTLGNHIDRLEGIYLKHGGGEDLADYIEGVRKLSIDLGDKLTGSRSDGIVDDLVRTAMAIKATATMGLPNLSTPLVNWLDGHIHPLMTEGLRRLRFRGGKNSSTLRGDYQKELQQLEREVHTKLSSAEMIGSGADAGLDAMFSKEYLDAVRTLYAGSGMFDSSGTIVRHATKKLANVVSAIASPFLKLQGEVEHRNRKFAFEIGAADELEFLDRHWKDRFLGENPNIPQWLVKKYSLDPTKLAGEDFDRDEAGKAWELFRMERAKRAGYDMIFNTQFQYNMAARHWFEGSPIGKMAMMYQNYPLHWIMTYEMGWGKLIDKLKHDEGAGVFGPTTKQRSLGHYVNPETAYVLSFSSAHAISSAGRMFSPVVFGSLFAAPGFEVLEELIQYFTGDSDQKHKAFFGGAANLSGAATAAAASGAIPGAGAAAGLKALAPLQSPMMSDSMKAVSYMYARHLDETGGLYWWAASPTNSAARVVTGLNPFDPRIYDKRGDLKSTKDIIKETYLWGSFRAIPKWGMLANHVSNGKMSAAALQAWKIAGIRENYDRIDMDQSDKAR